MHHVPGPGDTHWYWVVYDIPANVTSLEKNSAGVGTLGNNSVNERTEYAPPCSKGPGEKIYTYTVYALSAEPQISVSASDVTRDVLLDVPSEVVENLNNSVEVGTKEVQTPDGKVRSVLTNIKSYPYMLFGFTPGDSGLIRGGNNPATQSLREKFRDIFGKWPKNEQFKAFRDQRMAEIAAQEFSKEEVDMAVRAAGKRKKSTTAGEATA